MFGRFAGESRMRRYGMWTPRTTNRRWTTRDGKSIAVRCMDTSHLVNALAFVERLPEVTGYIDWDDEPVFDATIIDGLEPFEWAELFQRELRKRGVAATGGANYEQSK